MKKIVSAAAIAAMAMSFAAADVKVALNYRSGTQVLEHVVADKNGDPHGTSLFNSFTGNRKNSDALSIKGSAEYGGVEVEFTPSNTTDPTNKTSNTVLEKYNGWINFGGFMLKSGKWDSRAVGRVNKDMGNHEGPFWGELAKPGLSEKLGVTKGLANDISNPSAKKAQTTMLQYQNKDWGLEARVAYLDADGTATTFANGEEGGDWVFDNEIWFGELGYTIDGIGRVMATTKFSHKDYAGALFFEPKIADLSALTSLLSFTYETQTNAGTDKSGDDVAANAMGVQARARYDLGDLVEGLSVTAMYDWEFGNRVESGVENVSDEKKPGFYASWAMLNLTYKYNDTFTPFLSLSWNSGSSCGKGGTKARAFDDTFTCSLRTYAGVEIYNTKNANLITGICWDAADMNNVDGDCVRTVSIPAILRIKF